MSKKRPPATDPVDSPIAWFGELLIAQDRGDWERAAAAKRELLRLGWRCSYRRPTAPDRKGGGR